MEYVDEDTFMLTDYGAAHLYGIIPLFYSERSINEMFAMSERWLNDKKEKKYSLRNMIERHMMLRQSQLI